jgi:hypothetical protein
MRTALKVPSSYAQESLHDRANDRGVRPRERDDPPWQDFDLALDNRTKLVARKVTEFLKESETEDDRFLCRSSMMHVPRERHRRGCDPIGQTTRSRRAGQ